MEKTMDIDIGIDAKARKDITAELRKVLAETYALYGKTHSYHWNVTGPRFHALHTMFETQYRELWAALDVIAERLRALGAFAPTSTSDMAALATIPLDNDVPDAEQMVRNLVTGHETLARVAKAALEVAEEHDDPSTADLLTVRVSVAEKTAWMLRSSV